MQAIVERQGYQQSKGSPFGIGGAVAVHAVVIGAFLLMPKEWIDRVVPKSLTGYAVPLEKPRPVEKTPEKIERKQPLQKMEDPKPTVPDVIVPTITDAGTITLGNPVDLTTLGSGYGGSGQGQKMEITPPVPPVITGAQVDPRYAASFQPAYPPSMRRLEQEGKVTVRVTIGADGRVTAIEALSATDPAFWDSTREQAMKRWRFRPATRDGVAVESVKVMTVHFRMEG